MQNLSEFWICNVLCYFSPNWINSKLMLYIGGNVQWPFWNHKVAGMKHRVFNGNSTKYQKHIDIYRYIYLHASRCILRVNISQTTLLRSNEKFRNIILKTILSVKNRSHSKRVTIIVIFELFFFLMCIFIYELTPILSFFLLST